jgi:hypothetical protein
MISAAPPEVVVDATAVTRTKIVEAVVGAEMITTVVVAEVEVEVEVEVEDLGQGTMIAVKMTAATAQDMTKGTTIADTVDVTSTAVEA